MEKINKILSKRNQFHSFFRNSLGPFLLIVLCPPVAITIWYINVFLGGSIEKFAQLCIERGVFTTLYEIWKPYIFGSAIAWKAIGIFAALQLILMKIVPGKKFNGPVTPQGNVPVYKANGILCFFITLLLFFLSTYFLKLFSPSIVYNNFGAILGALNIFSLAFCLLLYFKGRFFPSSSDRGITGNPLFDYYWGIELYPYILGWNVKMFTNCRFGMMGWAIIILSFAFKQSELYGLSDSMLVALSLQLIYICKFFCWETGYLRSLDIMHDRAGYYICWGCLVWVPAVYTSAILYLVNHPNHLGTPFSFLIFLCGLACILTNYLADKQRQKMRASEGKCKIWGKKAETINATYITQDGEKRQNLLLISGWWGIARHFHYIPEILGALFWTLPALFTNALPYFYVVFLSILLIERSIRDDKRCALKYGNGWDAYCARVKYKIIPYIF